VDPMEKLKELSGGSAKVVAIYGGFEIRIVKPTLFPWYNVIRLLIDIGQEIWISRKEGRICITSEPAIQ
jgi:hypothetical protein